MRLKKRIIHNFSSYLTIKTLAINLSIAVVYIVLGKLGLTLAFVNPSATAVWAPTGIALAAILIFGYRVIPAIFFGAFIVNSITAGTVATSLSIGVGNTLEAIIGARLVKQFANGIHAFDRVSDIFKFTFFAAILSTTISADIGVTTLIVNKLANWSNFWPVWITWWLGDMGGNLVIAPLLLVWRTHPQIHFDYKKILHFFITYISLFIITEIVFSGSIPYPYLCIPIGVWIAFWFGRRGATVTTIIVALISIFYTLHGIGPFAKESSINHSLVLVQMFVSIFSLTTLTFATTVLEMRKGEKNLASHDERFKALIEKSFDAVVLIDATSKILYASPSVKRILDYSPGELHGKTGFDLIVPEDRKMTMHALAELVLKPGGTVTVKYRTMRKDKRILWIEATGTNLLFEPNINAVVVNFHDITEEKISQEKMLQEKMEAEAMLSSIGDGIIATDNKGKITIVNQTACETLGWNEKDLIGKLIVDTIPMEDETGKILPITDRPMTKVLSLGKKIVTSKTNYYVKKDQTKLPMRFTITPITLNGKLVGTIEVFHDITKEKELDRMKDEFISITSHELRTPMTAVNGLLSMILHGDYGPINDGLKKPLENIHISALRQIHLINDLLDVSRLQTGKIKFKLTNFSIGPTINDIVKSLRPLAEQKSVALTMKSNQETIVQGDIEWTKHIMNNLIGNALKFTDAGSVSISYDQDQDSVFITIIDTGIGIDPADHNKLFGKFQQLSTQQSNRPAGSGLGLYISRELARKMGGDVRLENSNIGKGSTFIFFLPKVGTPIAEKVKAELANEMEIAFPKETGVNL